MFSNWFYPICPILVSDKKWILDSINYLNNLFNSNLIEHYSIQTPTKEFYSHFIIEKKLYPNKALEFVAGNLNVPIDILILNYYEEVKLHSFTDEGLYTNYEEDQKFTAGNHQITSNNKHVISIESNTAKNPDKLIATIAHELSHVKLHIKETEDQDEEIVDLLTILSGFGIFTANGALAKMSTWSGNNYTGWKSEGGLGYLPDKLISYILAIIAFNKNVINPMWIKYCDPQIRSDFKKSLKYIYKHPAEHRIILK